MKRFFLLSLLFAGAGISAAAWSWPFMPGRADVPAYRTAASERGDIVATVTAIDMVSARIRKALI